MRDLDMVKQYFIRIIEETRDIDELLGRIYNAVQEETRYQTDLMDYGYNLLEEQFDYILEQGFVIENEYDLTDEIFKYARINGTLTYNTLKSERELISNYEIDEIQEFHMFDYCENTDQMHIAACEELFKNEFSDYLDNMAKDFPKLNAREQTLLACYLLSSEKDLGLEVNLNNVFCKETLKKANELNKEELEIFISPEIIKELEIPNKQKKQDKGISR